MARARYGGRAPERYTTRLYKDGADWLSLEDISAVELSVLKPSGATQTWACLLGELTDEYLEVTHLYEAGDLDEPTTPRGIVEYQIKPIATVAADVTGPVQWPARPLRVWAEFE
jgi:hypothetical protein